MRYIFLSDLHGYFEPAKILLEKINYDSTKDQLVFLGDYIDRGPNSKETIEFVMQHVKDGAIALKGNRRVESSEVGKYKRDDIIKTSDKVDWEFDFILSKGVRI